MSSEEEIEKAKEKLNKFCEYDDNLFLQDEVLYEYQDAIETLLQYIEELEKSDASKEQSSMNYYNKCKELEQENNKLNKMNDEMAEYMAIIRDCPNEDKGANLDCENRCSNNDSLYAECWKQYFEKKVEEE